MKVRDDAVGRSRLSSMVLPVASLSGAIGIWWLATVIFDIKPFLLPAPPDVVSSFLDVPSYLVQQAWVTLREILGGFALASVAGLFVGLALAASRVTERATLPVLVATNAVPKLAIAPLLVVWMGFGQLSKIVMVFMICFFPIVIAAMSGLMSTPTDLNELVGSLSASWWQKYLKVRIPWALPQIFVGLKVAISLAVVGAVVGEFSGGDRGLGYVIIAAGASANTPLAFASIALLAILGISLFYLLAGLERLLLPWTRHVAQQ